MARDPGELGYCLHRILLRGAGEPLGNAVYAAVELKTMQEVITLLVFAGFSVIYLDEAIRWNHLAGFACLIAAVFFVFHKW